MPLSAIVDGELVCAPLVDRTRWSDLRHTIVTLTCGHSGFPRVSGLGTQHFAHTRGSECQHAESAEHLHLKALAAAAAAAAGWSVATEVRGDGYVADVLAVRGESRVALEVQRSRQVLHEYQRRQAHYEQAGIRCVWLAASVPAGYLSGPEMPLFLVKDWVTDPYTVVAGRRVTVPEMVAALLSGKCRWEGRVRVSRQSSEVWRLLCPMCGRARDVPSSRVFSGRCSCGLPVVHDQRESLLPERGGCCGYWGPAMWLGRSVRHGVSERTVPAGHWCLALEHAVGDE